MLMPKKVKHRKHHRGRMKGGAKGATEVSYGDYGIQAYDGERTISLEDQQDQVARQLVSFLKRVRKRG